MNTNKLSKIEYPSSYNYNSEEYILNLVKKDECVIETVVNLEGKAGRPIYQGTEINF